MIKAAICDDDKLFTGQLERHLHLVAEDISIPLETEIFFDGAGFLEELNRGTSCGKNTKNLAGRKNG